MSEQRRDVRYAARIVARVARRQQQIELLTNDVSFRGAFIRSDAPPAIRQLLKVSFELPSREVVVGHAMVVRVVSPAEGNARVPGMGVQFWGPIDNVKAWEAFIHELKRREQAGTPAARVSDKVRRSSERFKLALEVELGGQTLVTRDVSRSGMAIRTDSPMPVGVRAQMQLRRGHESVVVDVVVRRRIDEPDFKGLGVEFVDVTAEARESIVALIRGGAPEEEAIFVSPGDPDLH